jgi:hypothetical protein
MSGRLLRHDRVRSAAKPETSCRIHAMRCDPKPSTPSALIIQNGTGHTTGWHGARCRVPRACPERSREQQGGSVAPPLPAWASTAGRSPAAMPGATPHPIVTLPVGAAAQRAVIDAFGHGRHRAPVDDDVRPRLTIAPCASSCRPARSLHAPPHGRRGGAEASTMRTAPPRIGPGVCRRTALVPKGW